MQPIAQNTRVRVTNPHVTDYGREGIVWWADEHLYWIAFDFSAPGLPVGCSGHPASDLEVLA